ncbi:L-ascorbate oxidase-like protein [Hordeum vulgare]|nr:L-ascorbate oxidase-like protein [Hordeum vulgare]
MRACAAAVVGLVALLAMAVRAEDPYLFFEWKVVYGTKSPMCVPQKMILIKGEFPDPTINCTSNNNIIVNVFNEIDKPLLFTWQHKKKHQHGSKMCVFVAGLDNMDYLKRIVEEMQKQVAAARTIQPKEEKDLEFGYII